MYMNKFEPLCGRCQIQMAELYSYWWEREWEQHTKYKKKVRYQIDKARPNLTEEETGTDIFLYVQCSRLSNIQKNDFVEMQNITYRVYTSYTIRK